MSLTLAVNDAGDIFLGTDGNLAIHRDLDAIVQAAQHAAQTLLAEMIYATDQGIPNFDIVWNGRPQVPQFDAFLRRALLNVDGVQQIQTLTITTAGGSLSYRAVIQTVFGTAVLNG